MMYGLRNRASGVTEQVHEDEGVLADLVPSLNGEGEMHEGAPVAYEVIELGFWEPPADPEAEYEPGPGPDDLPEE